MLRQIGCPPKLLSIVTSFHDNMHAVVNFDGEDSTPFPVKSGVKQGCVLAPTLFGIFFSMVLLHAFKESTDGVFLRTRSDGSMYNLSRLRAKSKTRTILIRELLFADDAALTSHTEEGLQRMLDKFSNACKEYGLTISIKKTQVMGQNVTVKPQLQIDNQLLETVQEFTYLGSTISSNTSLNAELTRRIAKATGVMAQLTKRVWENKNLTKHTKRKVYEACVLSTLFVWQRILDDLCPAGESP